MCGIAGRYAPGEKSADLALRHASELLMRRGPDGGADEQAGSLAVAHRRLAIIDLTEAASQPMWDSTRRYLIAFNGEIFNYRELRNELEGEGVQFATQSDTEVVLYWIARKGIHTLDRLNGFFAFAWYDTQQDTLFLVRDRFGEKPLYYHATGPAVAFASTIPALESWVDRPAIDPVSVYHFLRFTFIPEPSTIYQDVKKLPAGCIMECSREGHVLYQWYQPRRTDPPQRENVLREFGEVLQAATSRRLVGDVPAASLLSGGLDSSVVSLLAIRHRPGMETFHATFSDAPYLSEALEAEAVARHIGSRHHTITLSVQRLLRTFDDAMATMDQPYADASYLALFALSGEVGKQYKVSLSGDGADELLGGYRRHVALWYALHALPGSHNALRIANLLLKLVPEGRENALSDRVRQMRRMEDLWSLSPDQRYFFLASFAAEKDVAGLFVPGILKAGFGDDRLQSVRAMIDPSRFSSYLEADEQFVRTNDMLVKTDQAGMAHGLEIRSPFLDHEVVHFVHGLGDEWKIRGGRRKILLKAFEKDLPPWLFRKRKKGFEIPLESWLRTTMRSEVASLHEHPFIRQLGILEPGMTRQMCARFLAGEGRFTHLVYALVVLTRWSEGKKFSPR